ncbi:hypothetical protein ACOME3_001096 [Neoechinorhynchus agilis]
MFQPNQVTDTIIAIGEALMDNRSRVTLYDQSTINELRQIVKYCKSILEKLCVVGGFDLYNAVANHVLCDLKNVQLVPAVKSLTYNLILKWKQLDSNLQGRR